MRTVTARMQTQKRVNPNVRVVFLSAGKGHPWHRNCGNGLTLCGMFTRRLEDEADEENSWVPWPPQGQLCINCRRIQDAGYTVLDEAFGIAKGEANCECRRVYWAISMAPSVYPDHYRYSDGVDREIPYPDDAPFCMFCGRRLGKEVPHVE